MGTDIITIMEDTRTAGTPVPTIGEALRAAGWNVGAVALTGPRLAYAQISAALELGTGAASQDGMMDALDDLRVPTALIITDLYEDGDTNDLAVGLLQARALSSKTLCPVPFSLIFAA